LCVCVCVCVYNYEGGSILCHVLWHCIYKVKNIPYLGMYCFEGSIVDSTPDVFLGGVVGGRRAVWFMFEFHSQLLLHSWIQLLWFLVYFTTCLHHPVCQSELINIHPYTCHLFLHNLCICCLFFWVFFDNKFNFIVVHEHVSKML
jgi:hypothetical protein